MSVELRKERIRHSSAYWLSGLQMRLTEG